MNGYGYRQNPFQDTLIDEPLLEESLPAWLHDELEQMYHTTPSFNHIPPIYPPNADYQRSSHFNNETNRPSVLAEARAEVQAPAELNTSQTRRSAKGKAKFTKDAPPSKRQIRRRMIEAQYGNIGARDMPKGKTRIAANGLEWWDEDQQNWRPAAPHDEYRNEMIRLDNLLGRYDHTPKHGVHQDDITTISHAYGQQHWNLEDRSSWGNIRDDEGNQVMYLLDQPLVRNTEPVCSGFMTFNGLLMLDPDDNPINDWPGLPRCFSSQLEGARMEALRRIYSMTIPDFRARMPRTIQNKSGATRALFGLSTFNHRLLRFRRDYECPAWAYRERENGLRRFTLERLVAEGSPLMGPQALTTEGLAPPSKYEKERRKLENAGRNPEKAAGRAIGEKERELRATKAARRLQKLERQESARRQASTTPSQIDKYMHDGCLGTNSQASSPGTDDSRKRGHDDDSDGDIDGNYIQSRQKRARRCPKIRSTLESQLAEDGQWASFATPSAQISNEAQRASAAGADLYSLDLGDDVLEDIPDFESGDDIDIKTPAASAPPPSQDFRYVRPQNLAEKLIIKAALLFTCLDYQRYHSEGPPAMPEEESFAEQYQRLLTVHRNRWSIPGQAPPLVLIGKWLGSFSQIPAPELTEAIAGQLLGIPAESTADDRIDNATYITDDMATGERSIQWTAHLAEETNEMSSTGVGDVIAAEPFAGLQALNLEEYPAIGTNDETNEATTCNTLLGESDDQYFNDLFRARAFSEGDFAAVDDLPE
ncbi:hypothetical protein N7G274_010359 [Stereocaulon virgatum]|uniref:Uncharacterized protein n=1 Tax=Stereocaulon virgatum TaxID=373712 RepID=A0ABR3ZWN8_9LECA